jgi:ABC-type Na+ efflux pump permease subunit
MEKITKFLKNLWLDKRNLALILILILIFASIFIIIFLNDQPTQEVRPDIDIVDSSDDSITYNVDQNLTEEEKESIREELQRENPDRRVIVDEDFSYSEEKLDAIRERYNNLEYDESTNELYEKDQNIDVGSYD